MNNSITNKIHNEFTTSYLIICFSFFLPLSTSATSILAIMIILSWLIDADFGNKFDEIKDNKVVLAVLAYVAVFVIALLWTADIPQGLDAVKKQWKLLLLPIFLTSVRKEHFKFYLGAFITAMFLSALVAIPVWFGLFSTRHGTSLNPTPFMNRIDYLPFLALATFIVVESVIYRLQGKRKIAAAAIALIMTFNIFVSQGRTGQVAFIVLIFLTFFQYFKEKVLKATVISTICIFTILLGAYNFSTNFQTRTDQTITNFSDFENKPKTSLGQRLTFTINTWEIVTENLLIGVGSGDFQGKYKEINIKRSPAFPNTSDPHNHYLYVLAKFGIFGLAVFFSVFYFQLQFWNKTNDEFNRIRLGLIVCYLTIMLAGSYLTHHNATFLFVLFSSFLFKHPAPEESGRLPDFDA
ncbi:MAG: O-antigen ligase family protein [Desulfobulbaceae bacterium]|nr:O-antigen ligase family protein [Desulfobulbaceae bacterium]